MRLLEKLRTTPAWQNEDPSIRTAAVRDLDSESQDLLVEIAKHDEDSTVRQQAVARIQDMAVLAAIAVDDSDASVRAEASGVVRELVIAAEDPSVAEPALASLSEERDLVAVARSARHSAISRTALLRLHHARALGAVARRADHIEIAMEALARLEDPAELEAVALKSDNRRIAVAAFERLSAQSPSRSMLEGIARRSKQKTVARRARTALVELDEAAKVPNNDAAERICERLETLATADDFQLGREALGQLLEEWAALEEPPGMPLAQRVVDARRQVEAHLARLEAKQLEQKRAVRSREEALGLRRDLCLRVEQCNGAGAPADLQRLREAWAILPEPTADLAEELEALGHRFQAGVAVCERRIEARAARLNRVEALERVVVEVERLCNADDHSAEAKARWDVADKDWRGLVASAGSEAMQRDAEIAALVAGLQKRKDEADLRWRAVLAEKQADRERLTLEAFARLGKRCELVEALLASDELKLSRAERELRATRAALEELQALPDWHDRDPVVRRLKHAQVALLGKVRELRDFADWQRWANLGVQEDLCRQMEALPGATDDAALVGRFEAIMASWRQVSDVPKAQGEELWRRFKTAHDAVYPRCQVYREAQSAERERNLDHRRRLVEEAEQLASSNDWLKTVKRITALQAEWKEAGPVPRRNQRDLGNRLRIATSTFFARRKADLSQRKQEWAANLARKEELCARIEALAETDDVSTAMEQVRNAQSEWKQIGSVRRSRSDAVWQRFRTACGAIHERTRAAEREAATARAAEREALCAELEALLPAGGRADQLPEGLADAVRELQQRWHQAAEVPQPQRRQLTARFGQAISRVVGAYPEAFRGTSLDPAPQLRRLEKMCVRVESLVESEDVDERHASPAEILAAKWRDALADNLMGVRADPEAERQATIDEVRRLQGERRRLGSLPGEEGRRLAARFQRACDRLVAQLQPRKPERTRQPAEPSRSAS